MTNEPPINGTFRTQLEKQWDEELSNFIEINFFPPHVKSLISALSQSHCGPNSYEEHVITVNLKKQPISQL